MTLDPRELIRRAGLGTEQEIRAALAELARKDPGIQAVGAYDPTQITVNGTPQGTVVDLAMVNAQDSPTCKLRVPEPGAFIQFYGEVQGRFAALDAALVGTDMSSIQMQVVDDIFLTGNFTDGVYGARGTYSSLNSNIRLGLPTGWVAIRQPGTPDSTGGNKGGQGYQGMGVLGCQWSPPGERTLYVGCLLNGVGMGGGSSSQANFRNRRIMARIVG